MTYSLKELIQQLPARRSAINAWLAQDSGLDYEDWCVAQMTKDRGRYVYSDCVDGGLSRVRRAILSAVAEADFESVQAQLIHCFTADKGEEVLNLEPNLFDKFGEVNTSNLNYKPDLVSVALCSDAELRTLRVARDVEDAFIGAMDGKLGVVVEVDFATRESDAWLEGLGLEKLPSSHDAIPRVKQLLKSCPEQVQGMSKFGLCNEADYSPMGRPTLFAFFGLTDLEEMDQLEAAAQLEAGRKLLSAIVTAATA